jgi:hypothetical protein
LCRHLIRCGGGGGLELGNGGIVSYSSEEQSATVILRVGIMGNDVGPFQGVPGSRIGKGGCQSRHQSREKCCSRHRKCGWRFSR